MGVHPTPMRISGTFQRNVGTSIELEPERNGYDVAVWGERAGTNQYTETFCKK